MSSCPHRPPCSACPRFGELDIAPEARRALEELASAHGLPPVAVVSGQRAGFRLRARLAIRGRIGSPKVGLFEVGTHRVVHIPNCSIQHPLINHVASTVRRALVDARVSCYSDTAHLGLARYLQVVIERSTQTAQVVLVANTRTPEPLAACLDLVRARLGERLHSLWFNANCERGNAILGPDFHHWYGPASVVETFGGPRVHYPPGAFGQSNLEIAERIIGHVREQIPEGARVVEFYAGVGAIGLSVLARTRAIVMNEVSPQSLQGLELGLDELDAASRARISVLPGPAGAVADAMSGASIGSGAEALSGADVVIADPPRKGLDPELTELLGRRAPERLVYVSCDLESLLRDTALLTAQGRLRLAGLAAFDLMPFTGHVETVARFDRA